MEALGIVFSCFPLTSNQVLVYTTFSDDMTAKRHNKISRLNLTFVKHTHHVLSYPRIYESGTYVCAYMWKQKSASVTLRSRETEVRRPQSGYKLLNVVQTIIKRYHVREINDDGLCRKRDAFWKPIRSRKHPRSNVRVLPVSNTGTRRDTQTRYDRCP